jgi:hypothetical protein
MVSGDTVSDLAAAGLGNPHVPPPGQGRDLELHRRGLNGSAYV